VKTTMAVIQMGQNSGMVLGPLVFGWEGKIFKPFPVLEMLKGSFSNDIQPPVRLEYSGDGWVLAQFCAADY